MQINHPSLPRSLRFESTRSLSDRHRSVKRTSLAPRNDNHKGTFDWIPKLRRYAWLCFPDPFCAHISALYSRTQRGPMSKEFVVVNDRFNFPLFVMVARSRGIFRIRNELSAHLIHALEKRQNKRARKLMLSTKKQNASCTGILYAIAIKWLIIEGKER